MRRHDRISRVSPADELLAAPRNMMHGVPMQIGSRPLVYAEDHKLDCRTKGRQRQSGFDNSTEIPKR
jgi:hypothetical protein